MRATVCSAPNNMIDPTVRKESLYIALWCAALCAALVIVWSVLSGFEVPAVLGAVWGTAVAAGNFFLMARNVQRCTQLPEEAIRKKVRSSQFLRMIGMLALTVVAVKLLSLNLWTCIIPLFFPRIAIAFRPLFKKMDETA